jgi:hypothetical protein
MALRMEAYVDVAHDGGLELFDRIGAIVVHIDGDVMTNNKNAVTLIQIADATEHLGPLYSVEIPGSLPITVQWWQISSIRQGRADELIENTNV